MRNNDRFHDTASLYVGESLPDLVQTITPRDQRRP